MSNHQLHIDLSFEKLLSIAVEQKEGQIASNGAFSAITGKRTGRSPKDRFIVRDLKTDMAVDWGTVNQPISPQSFQALWEKAMTYLENKPQAFSSHLTVGADRHYSIQVKVITELAWHQLFCYNQFIRESQLIPSETQWTLLSVPGLNTDPVRDNVNSDASLLIDFTQKRVLACGLYYAGEMKKAMFSVMNFLMPEKGVLPMHCAANADKNGKVALFFGLSGTGKTTLSSDPERYLIGDDEHGWSPEGIFNFEGGCYAKCIQLSKTAEPVIWEAIREKAVLENVVLDPITKVPDFNDGSLTQNTRANYPLEHIPLRVLTNQGGHPSAVFFLTCDLYGVLPPVAKLNHHQAAYYFLSGYTALVGSTEVGNEPNSIKPIFSVCFGAPFFPRPAYVYAELLMDCLNRTNCPVYLINTGWMGGRYGQGGKRFDIPTTRAILHAVLNTEQEIEYEILPGFGIEIPKSLPGVETTLLNPINTWPDPKAYQQSAKELIEAFQHNFQKFSVSQAILAAQPSFALV